MKPTIPKIRLLLNASSLSHAIFICLVISVFCGSLVLIFHFKNIFIQHIDINNNLLSNNNSAINYFLKTSKELNFEEPESIDLFDDGIYSTAIKKQWGFYEVLTCKTSFKKDTITSSLLIGKSNSRKNNTALYSTNYGKPLKLSGKTQIYGNLELPLGKYEEGYINGVTGNKVLVSGITSSSNQSLPKIDVKLETDFSFIKPFNVNLIENRVLVNEFDKPLLLINANDFDISNLILKGHIVLFSNTTIKLDSSIGLEDVLVVAPNVLIKKGFVGTVQILAKNEILLEDNVWLKYPSSLTLTNKDISGSILIGEHCKIAGGILMDNISNLKIEHQLVINENSLIIGNVYCSGKTQLEGEIIGRIYTDKFFLKTETLDYENVLLNASINLDSLPKQFVELPFFNKKNYSYEVIKSF